MKIPTTISNFNNKVITVSIIVSVLVGCLMWLAGIITALVILLCVAILPTAINFLIINPSIKLISSIKRKPEVI